MMVLKQINLGQSLSQTVYLDQLPRYQALVGALTLEAALQQRPVIIAFEGWDAAGKGGCIKRLTEGLDPRHYVTYSMDAPEAQDPQHHYLYRFWQRLPEPGRVAIFDRSWYGRVLGDRVEGRCSEGEWRRAYREINQFERQLVDFGTIVFKFWLHITREEQFRRLQTRAATPEKAWKLTSEDWRNNELWDAYAPAAEEMMLKTSTVAAPWTIIEAMDKYWARVKVLRTVAETLVRVLSYEPEAVDAQLKKAIRKRTRSDPRVSQVLEAADTEVGVEAEADVRRKHKPRK
jgi:polyphosphate kinase 2 (PPK2 family)